MDADAGTGENGAEAKDDGKPVAPITPITQLTIKDGKAALGGVPIDGAQLLQVTDERDLAELREMVAEIDGAKRSLGDLEIRVRQIRTEQDQAVERVAAASREMSARIKRIAKRHGLDTSVGKWNFNHDTMMLQRIG